MAIRASGGLGLFLLGMIVMTEGLRSLAGNTMRRVLMRFTRTPLTGAITGALTTALLQSSSATIVATIGFVSAGLITFTASLGIIFGANVGTTVTGWMVALLGFRFQLGTAVLPLIFIGASLKLFAKGKAGHAGYALAGFGLIFVGITTLQAAMAGMTGLIAPERFPADTVAGRLQLVGLGMIFTVITQSSSAGVATALTALYTGAISFEQAAALVIGMDVGTTVKAVVASLSGSINAKRTALSHVLYNLWTATLALSLLSAYIWLWNRLAPGQLFADSELALVMFHTSSNLLGVLTILPVTRWFARLIIWLLPGQGATYTNGLSEELLRQPNLALNAVQGSIHSELLALLWHLRATLGDPQGQRIDLVELDSALEETSTYLDQIHLTADQDPNWPRLINLMHTLDHLQRLLERCEEESDRATVVNATPELADERALVLAAIADTIHAMPLQQWDKAAHQTQAAARLVHKKVRPYREATLAAVANGHLEVATATSRLGAIRWLRRVSKHLARIQQHLQRAMMAIGEE
ncbi:Na/Pi cotransporter family protein [Leptolyngbya sp. KIOST-1]|uniref:Na/Pi cotransporter family protein n=1 Tax=Leptolyngbya sp. KIOST-1 TaxID=1229172 RepID=UPI00055C9B76|nr:Na/Pi symporter [Leptolyngbya sp. KIOST-1]